MHTQVQCIHKYLMILFSDLTFEAEVLASLNHPNIIKLRGTSMDGAITASCAGFSQGPSGGFLVIDRLTETLDKKIAMWHRENHHPNCRKSMLGRGRIYLNRPREAKKLCDNRTHMDEQLNIGTSCFFFAAPSFRAKTDHDLILNHATCNALSICFQLCGFLLL